MTKPNKLTKKAFCITSMIGGVLKANPELKEIPELSILSNHIDNAMKVFNITANDEYWELSKQVNSTWEILSEKHTTILDISEVPKFIEYIIRLINPEQYRAFMAMAPYESEVVLSTIKDRAILASVLDLDSMLNGLLGTKPWTCPLRKKAIVKVKKPRDKAKPKKKVEKTVSRNKLKKSQGRKDKEEFVRRLVEKASLRKK